MKYFFLLVSTVKHRMAYQRKKSSQKTLLFKQSVNSHVTTPDLSLSVRPSIIKDFNNINVSIVATFMT